MALSAFIFLNSVYVMGILSADQGALGADEGSSTFTLLFLLEGLGILVNLEYVLGESV